MFFFVCLFFDKEHEKADISPWGWTVGRPLDSSLWWIVTTHLVSSVLFKLWFHNLLHHPALCTEATTDVNQDQGSIEAMGRGSNWVLEGSDFPSCCHLDWVCRRLLCILSHFHKLAGCHVGSTSFQRLEARVGDYYPSSERNILCVQLPTLRMVTTDDNMMVSDPSGMTPKRRWYW